MKGIVSALYSGSLVHRRYFPRRHELRYRVTHILVNIDELPDLSRKLWLFGYNRRRLFGIADRNHGPGDGTAIAKHVRRAMDGIGLARPIGKIFMFCYPAVFGQVFNPLTVYLGYDNEGQLAGVVYEVNNTFGQRHSYAIAADGGCEHRADKQFYVSPFNATAGEYRFSCSLAEDVVRLNIALFEGPALKLCARFEGKRQALTDMALLRGLFPLLFQPLKIIGGIHWEALKLYLKGLRPKLRPAHAKFEISFPKVKP